MIPFTEKILSYGLSTDASNISALTLIKILSAFFLICSLLKYVVRSILHRIEIKHVAKRSVVISGCDSGFGKLLAKTLDNKGVQVFAGCLTETGAEELRNETSSRLKTVILDVTDTDSIQQAYKYVENNVGQEGIWGLVNNAGVMPTAGPAEWTTIESFKTTFDVNLLGTIDMTLHFLPLLRKSAGRLVCVSSVTANCPLPGLTNYVVSKAAVKSFAGCMRRELFSTGITVHSIEPGGFKTNLTNGDRLIGMFTDGFKQASPQLQSYYGGNIARYIMRCMKAANTYVDHQPQQVADGMAHALLAKFPKNQYLIGMDTKLFFGAMSWLPEWVVDICTGWSRPYGEIIEEFKELK